MSEFRDVIAHVISDRESATAELCKNLRNGKAFVAEIEEISDIELNTEQGRDARESILMHVLDRCIAAEILAQQNVQVTLYGQLVVFKVVRRKDNPADAQVEFGLMKLTDKDT